VVRVFSRCPAVPLSSCKTKRTDLRELWQVHIFFNTGDNKSTVTLHIFYFFFSFLGMIRGGGDVRGLMPVVSSILAPPRPQLK
jgi:hypothetical protein